MPFSFSSVSGSSGVTNITVSATSRQELTDLIENYTLSNQNGLSMQMPIVQTAYVPVEKYINIVPSAMTAPSSGGYVTVTVQSNDNWSWDLDEWLAASVTGGTSGNTIIPIMVSENTGSSRSGVITARCMSDSAATASTTVSQDGSYVKPYIYLGYYSFTANSESSTTAVSVSSNIDWYTICDSRWITLATQTGSGNGSISFTVDANPSEFNREGIITVFNTEYDIYVEFVVRQVSSVKPFIALDPQSFVVAGSGSTNTISVSANCDYDITTDVDWIVLGASSGSGYGSVTFTTQANRAVYQDIGNIVFSNSAVSSYVSVARRPVEKFLSASTSGITSKSTGGTFDVSVYSNVNWVVRVDTQEETLSTPWLSATPLSGSNDDTIRISVASGTTEKTGSVILSNSRYGLDWEIDVVRNEPVDGTKIFYKSIDGNIINPTGNGWGANIVSNTYENGQGLIQFDGDVTTVPLNAFYSANGYKLTEIILPDTITSIERQAFEDCQNLITCKMPDSLVTIGNRSFYSCTGLTGNLVLPNSLTAIGQSAFYYCYSLTGQLTIPSSVETIGDHAFYYCSGFTGHLYIPETIELISGYTFQGCSGLTGLSIGKSVARIWDSAFRFCSGIREIYSYPTTQPILGSGVFYQVSSTGTFHYPSGSNYNTFIHNSSIPSGWTNVDDL